MDLESEIHADLIKNAPLWSSGFLCARSWWLIWRCLLELFLRLWSHVKLDFRSIFFYLHAHDDLIYALVWRLLLNEQFIIHSRCSQTVRQRFKVEVSTTQVEVFHGCKFSAVLFRQQFEVEVFHNSGGGFWRAKVSWGLLCSELGVQEDFVDFVL